MLTENELEEVMHELKALSFLVEKMGLGVGVEEHPYEQDSLIFIGSKLSECVKKLEGK